jgi:hypothetical protein
MLRRLLHHIKIRSRIFSDHVEFHGQNISLCPRSKAWQENGKINLDSIIYSRKYITKPALP